jgi:hypothetical protein
MSSPTGTPLLAGYAAGRLLAKLRRERERKRERERERWGRQSGGWDATSPRMHMLGASRHFAAGAAAPARAATVRPASAKCMRQSKCMI